jgi:ferritin
VVAPKTEFGGIVKVFEQILAHEQGVTERISALFALARDEKDYASEITLHWYVTEQVEEEATVGQIVDHLHAVGDKGGGIWYLDSRMGKRGKAD